jgi:hypothetical protein
MLCPVVADIGNGTKDDGGEVTDVRILDVA